jgi:hypothetical protein
MDSFIHKREKIEPIVPASLETVHKAPHLLRGLRAALVKTQVLHKLHPLGFTQTARTEWILRIGVFGTFLGHGILAYQVKPGWIPYLTGLGITKATAAVLMKGIGVSDLFVAFFSLLKPVRILLLWATFWAFSTAVIRPLTGEAMLDCIERTANWSIPLALLTLHGFPNSLRSLWRIR